MISKLTLAASSFILTSSRYTGRDSHNLIKAFDGNKLSYKDIEITCVVLSDKGLNNIKNPFILAIVEKNDYSDVKIAPKFKDLLKNQSFKLEIIMSPNMFLFEEILKLIEDENLRRSNNSYYFEIAGDL